MDRCAAARARSRLVLRHQEWWFYTINNGTESTQGYLRLSVDVTDNTQIFGEVLLNHDVQRFAAGANFYETASDSKQPVFLLL